MKRLRTVDCIRRADASWEFVEDEEENGDSDCVGDFVTPECVHKFPSIAALFGEAVQEEGMDDARQYEDNQHVSSAHIQDTEEAGMHVRMILPSPDLENASRGQSVTDVQKQNEPEPLDQDSRDIRLDQGNRAITFQPPDGFELAIEAPRKNTGVCGEESDDLFYATMDHATTPKDKKPERFDYFAPGQNSEECLSHSWTKCLDKQTPKDTKRYQDLPDLKIPRYELDRANVPTASERNIDQHDNGVSFGNFSDFLDDLSLTAVQELSQLEATAIEERRNKICTEKVNEADMTLCDNMKTTLKNNDSPIGFRSEKDNSKTEDKKFQGFRLAGSGRHLSPAATSVARASKMFLDINFPNSETKTIESDGKGNCVDQPITNDISFQNVVCEQDQSISHASVPVSKQAIGEIRSNANKHPTCTNEKDLEQESLKQGDECVGFQTAGSKRRWTVSRTALKKANRLLEENGNLNNENFHCLEENKKKCVQSINQDDVENSKTNSYSAQLSQNVNSVIGFQTAGSKREWCISDAAMAKAKQMFAAEFCNDSPSDNAVDIQNALSIDEDHNTHEAMKENDLQLINNHVSFTGLQTASGKRITVSSASKQKAKDLFDSSEGQITDAKKLSPDNSLTPVLKKQILGENRINYQTPVSEKETTKSSASCPSRMSRFQPSRFSLAENKDRSQVKRPNADRKIPQVFGENNESSNILQTRYKDLSSGVGIRTGAHKIKRKFNTPRSVPVKKTHNTSANIQFRNPGDLKETNSKTKISCKQRSKFDGHSKMKQALDSIIQGLQESCHTAKPLQDDLNTVHAPSALQLGSNRLPIHISEAEDYKIQISDNESLGWPEIHRKLMADGLDETYASNEWVRHHYQLVIWKLARAELAGWPLTAGAFLKVDILMDQLHRRYRKQFIFLQEPYLRAVKENLESSWQCMVLMVSSMYGYLDSSKEKINSINIVELTDGWDFVQAHCDPALENLIKSNQIHIGQKLRITGAVFQKSSSNDSSTKSRSFLKLCINGTHRAPQNSKLGRQVKFPILTLSRIKAGGLVQRTLVVILRKYPVLAWSQLPSGVRTFQTPIAADAMHQRVKNDFELVQSRMRSDIWNEEVNRCKTLIDSESSANQVDYLYARMMTSCEDPAEFLETLDDKRKAALWEYYEERQRQLNTAAKNRAEEKIRNETPAAVGSSSINTITFLVGEVTHKFKFNASENIMSRLALITVKNPSEEVMSIKEADIYSVTSLVSFQETYAKLGSFYESLLHLKSTKGTTWNRLLSNACSIPSAFDAAELPRRQIQVDDLQAYYDECSAKTEVEPVFLKNPEPVSRFENIPLPWIASGSNIFDLVEGIIIHIGSQKPLAHSSQLYQWILIADATILGSEKKVSKKEQETTDAVKTTCFLAIYLLGQVDEISWLNKSDVGSGISVRNLELGREIVVTESSNRSNQIWKALGGRHSEISLISYKSANNTKRKTKAAQSGTDNGSVIEAVTLVGQQPEILQELKMRFDDIFI